jgi:hypothetical protein
MAKVFIYPTTSLILTDLVKRYGHEPLGAAIGIRERVQAAGFDSPPLQITPEEPKKGLRWAAVEVPSGVRGRMALSMSRPKALELYASEFATAPPLEFAMNWKPMLLLRAMLLRMVALTAVMRRKPDDDSYRTSSGDYCRS